MRKSTIDIRDRFAKFYDTNLGKFNPELVEKLSEQIQVFRVNAEILENLFSEKVKMVWVSRRGNIAETLNETETTATITVKRGKGAGNVVPLWQNVKTLTALQENETQIERIQALIDAVRTVGVDNNAAIQSRKVRASKYPNAVTMRFIPSSVAIPELDANDGAIRLYNANAEIIGYNVQPKKRVVKSNE